MRSTTRRIIVAGILCGLAICGAGVYAALAGPTVPLSQPVTMRALHAMVIAPSHVLKPAPSLTPTILYPTGVDNGEQIWEDTGAATIKYAPIIATTGGSPNAIVALTTGSKIKVLGYFLTSSAAGTVTWQDEAGTPNKMTGTQTLAANGQVFVPASKFGVFDTGTSAALDLAVTGTSNTVGGYVVYVNH